MVLSDSKIIEELKNGNITITGFDLKNLNPNSVDLTLGNKIKMFKLEHSESILDVKDKNQEYIELIIPEEGYVLLPQVLYIMGTNEKAGSNMYHSQLKGKSSLARLGLFIDCTASWGDVGFINNWTLEVSVVHPLRIYPNMRVAQIIFTKVYGEVINPYNKKLDSKYNNDNFAQPSLYYKNFDNEK